jgi:hypothetical protein
MCNLNKQLLELNKNYLEGKPFIDPVQVKINLILEKYKKQKTEPEKEIEPIKELIQPAESKRDKFKKYKKEVWKLTKLQPIEQLEHFEKRGFKGYHLDHILSIWNAFNLALPAYVPADISNLRFIPARDNMNKGIQSDYTNIFKETV